LWRESTEGAVDAGRGVFELVKNRHIARDDLGLAPGIEDGAPGFIKR
jgi:hypothetical protein